MLNSVILSAINKGRDIHISSERAEEIVQSLSYDNYFPYQDIVVNDDLLWKGLGPDCASRYSAIKRELKKKYQRPITILEVGANNGYFSINLVRDFSGSQAVLFDMTNRLKQICELNTDLSGSLIYMKKQLTPEDLCKIAKNAHFDVVVCMHVLHHIPKWKEFIQELFAVADTVIIETPQSSDSRRSYKTNIPAIEQDLSERNGSVIAATARVKPGKYLHMGTMHFGIEYEIELENGVCSSMYLFNAHNNNQEFRQVSEEQLNRSLSCENN